MTLLTLQCLGLVAGIILGAVIGTWLALKNK